jgi:hypothetical protein
MTTSRQPKGIPVGGQFAATIHAEPDVSINTSASTFERLGAVTSLLAADEIRWESEKAQLAVDSEARTTRRRRLAGARAATKLLAQFPSAATVTYTRDPHNGIVTMDSIEDNEGYTLYNADDMAKGVLPGNSRDISRRVAARQGVRQLMGTTPPPRHADQGITVLEAGGGTERLNLQTALDDGLAFLEAEELTPAQASVQRVETALGQWNDPGEDAQTRVRDMLTDLRHYAAANDIDLGHALDRSYEVFSEEHNDPAFKEGF